MFFLGIFMPILMIVLVVFVMPESPRWLVAKGRESDARDVLVKVYPPGFNVYGIIDDIKEALHREKEAEQSTGWGMIFSSSPAIARMLIVGVGIAIAQQAVGIEAIQYYLLDILAQSGIDNVKKQNVILIGLGIVKLFFVLVGGRLFDKKGRKPLFLASLAGMAIALLIVAIAQFAGEGKVSSGFTIAGLALYLAFFSIGMGPGAWLVPSEIFATSIRGKAMSLTVFANRVTATVMSATFLSTANGMGWGGFFLMLAMICLIVAAFVRDVMPETKGRSLEEMSLYFAEITGDNSILEAEQVVLAKRKQQQLDQPPALPFSDDSPSETKAEGAEMI
jgi:MFS family permease